MSAKKLTYISSLLALPVLYFLFYGMHVSARGHAIEQWLPRWDRLLLLFTIVLLERLYAYRYAVSQRYILARDIIANIVNLWITAFVVGLILVPVLVFFPEHFLGRKFLFAAPGQLGPFWFQVATILLVVSLFRYWMHRMQHTIPFLWELHSYHHRVTDLTASNGEVSNPVDFALRNVIIFLILGVIGFDPIALVLTVPFTNITANFSHCAADIKAGFLNYIFVTPEVHRWHHTAKVPEGRGLFGELRGGVHLLGPSFRHLLPAAGEWPGRHARTHRASGWAAGREELSENSARPAWACIVRCHGSGGLSWRSGKTAA